MEKELLINLEKLHTTKLGIIRIKKNLCLNDYEDVIEWYISFDDCIITVNACSFTIITAHKKKYKS